MNDRMVNSFLVYLEFFIHSPSTLRCDCNPSALAKGFVSNGRLLYLLYLEFCIHFFTISFDRPIHSSVSKLESIAFFTLLPI
ncbi:hypothetical protein Ahy_B02g057385 isoform D [Arachis hypogaea]|uniref:Uncharacterized protein n=1 Tax=Arachis hypogaea TaxID=3818 RepID=A0A445ABT6_ARAHY|nr:hypothetical protein Ahy_B02g057385 isoform D [Arachis hypogaea]